MQDTGSGISTQLNISQLFTTYIRRSVAKTKQKSNSFCDANKNRRRVNRESDY